MRFAPGDRVRASRVDPPHHTRVPRYVRGAVGTVVAVRGEHPLPDDVVRGRPAPPQPVYAVRFSAHDLFGEGAHRVTVDVWEARLEPAEEEAPR